MTKLESTETFPGQCLIEFVETNVPKTGKLCTRIHFDQGTAASPSTSPVVQPNKIFSHRPAWRSSCAQIMDQEFARKKEKALDILSKTQISARNYMPPMYIFLWKKGVRLPPPHFLAFHAVLVLTGVPFGVSAVGFWLIEQDGTPDGLIALKVFAIAAIFAGMIIALYYKLSALLNRIPKWKNL